MPRPRHTANRSADAFVRAVLLGGRWIERLLRAHDPPLTPAQYVALEAASGREGLMATELARRLDISAAAVSQVVAGLETAGLVARGPGEHDRRRRPLELTAEGRRVFDSARASLRMRLGPLLPHQADALEELAAKLAGEPPPRRGPPRPP
jgi:DNA-binding MarR family transcriptional regulator